jgi:ribonuclease I
MPGTQSCLYDHEWYAHGTCSGLAADPYFEDAQALAAKFIALPHFRELISSQAGKSVTRAQLTSALTADLGAASEASLLFLCRKNGHDSGGERYSFSEVDVTLDAQAFMKFPSSESFGQTADKSSGSCPSDGILITGADATP